jgi:hypothetical protein
MSKAYALPIHKGSVCTVTDEDWLRHRRLELYHRSMDQIIRDINELCSRETFTFALHMTKCDAVVLFIIRVFWSWMAPRWLLYFCAMSTNALCAHVLTVSWIELMSLTPIATPNLSKKKEVDAARSEHYNNASYTVITKVSAKHQGHEDSGAPDIISYPIFTMISGSFDPDVGIPDIEPDIEPDIGYLITDIVS